ncbi:hypothetical protein [Thiocapsa sp. UBA6158]|jgi:hypothetical protein|uniref:hypothetical protein n=1 Tax=Thiocapsa sp. UBA6158 TaxID=1947692 RepID=UPI0025FCDF85|nr:hypothetical protein [Thiocapsa sp. UBA6158]
MNQRFDLVVIVGAIFFAIFVATAVILLILGVPGRGPEPVAETTARPATPGPIRQPDRARAFAEPAVPTLPPGWRDERSFGYGASRDGGSVIDGYRFRPLEEPELRRFGGRADVPDARSANGFGMQDRGLGDPVFRRDDRLPQDFMSDWGETPYRFRPTETPRSAPDPRRPPRDPRDPRGFTDPPLLETPPQWGATPPVLLPSLPPPLPDLYPSFVPPNDHRLTVR